MKKLNELRKLAGLPLIKEEVYLNETMLDDLITKIGKDCGVDFKDADGPAVRKAMAEIYHAATGKGRYG